MRNLILRPGIILGAALLVCGCNAYQPTKNVWKDTKGLWNTYVSPPASVDYEDKGNLAPEAVALSSAIMGIDIELGKLERVMQNADKPPTQEWLSNLFASFPWLNGFAGVKYDGTILGQEPPNSIKQLDFIPLLYEDKKQNSRALRADVQPGPLGPEVMLATPLYDGVDFLGIVVAYFDMRSLMRFSGKAADIVALAPGALLWPGKYDFAATPLAGVDWAKVTRESTAGTCSNSTGSFFYMVRFLGNLPLVFATPASGAFPEGNGSLEQGAAYFPQEREKLPPPPMPERRSAKAGPEFEKPEPEEPPMAEAPPEPAQRMPEASDRNVIPAGSRESMLLKGGRGGGGRQIQERSLEGENIEVIRAPERRSRPEQPPLELVPEPEGPTLPGGRPSPFGPREESAQPADSGRTLPGGRPSPFGPRQEAATPAQPVETAPEPASPAPSPAPAATPAPARESHITGLEGIALPQASRPAVAPATPEAKPKQVSPQPEVAPQAPAAPQISQPAAPEAAGEAKEAAPAGAPAKLPGGRPSPFGPRN